MEHLEHENEIDVVATEEQFEEISEALDTNDPYGVVLAYGGIAAGGACW